jgi:hypothetical protein
MISLVILRLKLRNSELYKRERLFSKRLHPDSGDNLPLENVVHGL